MSFRGWGYSGNIAEELKRNEKINIYGAGVMGKALMRCLSDAPYYKKIFSFIVEDTQNHPSNINGIPVTGMDHASELVQDMLLVALHEKHMKKAMMNLKEAGFTKVVPVSFDSDLWTTIRWNWLKEKAVISKERLCTTEDRFQKELHLYVVHTDSDKILSEKFEQKSFEIPIQAGAALAKQKIFDIQDNLGDHISHKNKQYCELTALYWIWKNDRSDYAGLSHYRRRFLLTERQAGQILESDVDVIVTVPVINFPSVREQYFVDHDGRDWDIMLEAIKELYPCYYETADQIQKGTYYFAYNMFIARKEILDCYCEWLFTILKYCEERISMKNDSYQDRYAGFLAERLLTVYFSYHKQYKMIIAEKHFIESA